MVSITTNNTLRLQDGRQLGYADYGDASGKPIFFFHGTPGSRLSGLLPGVVAGPLGARVIAIDRPGYGLSDFKSGRTIGDWPRDVTELADALGFERFAVLGFSGGGPYAAVCAHQIPQRLTQVGIVSGIGPLDARSARASSTRMQRFRFWGARHLPRLVRLAVWWSLRGVKRSPERFFAAWAASVSDYDRSVLARPA
ncbi:MAG: alpha/beta hydrolase, partial [Dehalococcoidia bacterium]